MALASPISPVTPATAARSWNPLKFRGTELPTELLILVKVLALVVLLANRVRILPDPWLPFVPGVPRPGAAPQNCGSRPAKGEALWATSSPKELF